MQNGNLAKMVPIVYRDSTKFGTTFTRTRLRWKNEKQTVLDSPARARNGKVFAFYEYFDIFGVNCLPCWYGNHLRFSHEQLILKSLTFKIGVELG